MTGSDDWNDWDSLEKTQIPGLQKQNEEKGNEDEEGEINDILRNYLDQEVAEDILLGYLNNCLGSNDFRTEISLFELSLGKLSRGINHVIELFNFDFELIQVENLMKVDSYFIEKYMYALRLLDSLDDKLREDFEILKKKISQNIGILCQEWGFEEEEARNFMHEFLNTIQENIDDIARKHISIGVRIRECIVLKSQDAFKLRNLETFVELDCGTMRKKRDTLSQPKVGDKTLKSERTTQNFTVHIEEGHVVGDNTPRIANSSELPNPFAQTDIITRKIEQISLDELSA
ncbi:hypothetical protein KKD70_01970 [Patescibacteria group bacterium]|nr:hypothetical protein [Patescibacteria group bacterium]